MKINKLKAERLGSSCCCSCSVRVTTTLRATTLLADSLLNFNANFNCNCCPLTSPLLQLLQLSLTTAAAAAAAGADKYNSTFAAIAAVAAAVVVHSPTLNSNLVGQYMGPLSSAVHFAVHYHCDCRRHKTRESIKHGHQSPKACESTGDKCVAVLID